MSRLSIRLARLEGMLSPKLGPDHDDIGATLAALSTEALAKIEGIMAASAEFARSGQFSAAEIEAIREVLEADTPTLRGVRNTGEGQP